RCRARWESPAQGYCQPPTPLQRDLSPYAEVPTTERETVTNIATGPARALDRKLGSILAGTYTPDDFVIADAKDGDMAFGVTAAGTIAGEPSGLAGPGRYGTREDYVDAMRA